MSHIFISYSRKDIDFAQKIVDALAANNLDTWIDWKSIPKGVDWEQEIYRGIEEADAFLFLISPDSVKSAMCNKEILHAVKNGKRIIPIVLRDANSDEFLDEMAKKEIAKRNWIFCRDRQDEFNKALEETRNTIQTDYEWLKFHRSLQVKALEWDHNQRENSFLLTGKELQDVAATFLGNSGKEPNPTDLHRAFLLASQEFENVLRRAESQRRRRVITGLSMGLLVVALLAVFAWGQRNNAVASEATAIAEADARGTAQALAEENEKIAQTEATISRARELASLAKSTESIFPQRSLLLVIEAKKKLEEAGLNFDGNVDEALLRMTSKQVGIPLHGDGSAIEHYWSTANGKWLITQKEDTLYVWDLTTPSPWRSPQVYDYPNVSADLSFNTDWLIIAEENKFLLVDLKTAAGKVFENAIELPGGMNECVDYFVSENGKWFFTWCNPGVIQSYDLSRKDPTIYNTVVASSDVTNAFKKMYADYAGTRFLIQTDTDWLLWNISNESKFEKINLPDELDLELTSFSPDGKWLITTTLDHEVSLWDLSAETTHEIRLDLQSIASIEGLKLSADSQWLLVTTEDASEFFLLRMSDINQHNQVFFSIKHLVNMDELLFCPDGSCLVALEDVFQDRPKIFLLDLEKVNPWEARTLLYEGFKDEFRGLNISPTGRWLVSQNSSFFVYLWDLRQPQKEPYQLAGHEGWVNSTLFSPDEKLLLTASEDRVMRFWQLDLPNPSIQSIKLVGHDKQLVSAEFTANSRWLLTAGYELNFRIWDAQKITAPHVLNQDVFGTELFRGHDNWITGLSFSPDTRYLLSSSYDGKVKKWSISDNNLFGESEMLLEIDREVFDVEYSKDGNWIATAGGDGIVYLMKSSGNNDFSETFSLAGHEGPVHVVEFSPNSQWLATGGANGSLIIWDLSMGGPTLEGSYYSCCLSTLATGFGISDLQFTSDNKWLASSDSYELTALWNIERLTRPLKPTRLLRGHIDAPVLDLEFSPDGRLLATGGGDYRVALWNMFNIDQGYIPLTTYTAGITDLGGLGFSGITGVKFSPDGRWLISITGESTSFQGESVVTLWDLKDPTLSPKFLRGHEANVISIAISPDGEWLATGDMNPERNGTALVWNLNYLDNPPIVLEDHFGRVNQIAISADNKWLATADIDIHLWSLDEDETIKIACRLAGRNLSSLEWQQYFPSEEYRSTCPQYPAGE